MPKEINIKLVVRVVVVMVAVVSVISFSLIGTSTCLIHRRVNAKPTYFITGLFLLLFMCVILALLHYINYKIKICNFFRIRNLNTMFNRYLQISIRQKPLLNNN
jgi:hypothetical protein